MLPAHDTAFPVRSRRLFTLLGVLFLSVGGGGACGGGGETNGAGGFLQIRGVAYDAANKRVFAAEHDAGGSLNALHILPVN